MEFSRRRAVSPIIATLLLIAIAVAAGIIVYVYTNSLASGLTGGGGGQVSQQIQLQSYSFNPIGANGFTSSGTSGIGQTVDLFLENTGSTSVVISSIYFDGNLLNEWGGGPTIYAQYLEAPTTSAAYGCYGLVAATGFTSTAQTTAIVGANGATATCGGTAGTCAENANSFCVKTSSAQNELGGLTAAPLGAQSSAQLIIALSKNNPATSGTSHTIKLLTSTGGQAVFTVTTGRSG